METRKRLLTNWLKTWMAYTMPRSQAPETTLFWTGLFALSTALRRNVKVSKEYLGGWECYPNLYIIFVADAGVINKSTTIDFAAGLLEAVPILFKSQQEITVPVILQNLQKSPDASIYLIISEFGTIMEKAGLGMYTKLIDAFDNRKIMDESTMSRGEQSILNPCVNLIAATTPDWITGNMPQSVLQGGFGSRVIWLYEREPRQRKIFYNKVVKLEATAEMEKSLINDLIYISEKVEGEFEVDPAAVDYFEEWFKENATAPEGSGKGIKGYYVRRPAYILKLAMLTKIAKSDELILRSDDIVTGIRLMAQVENKVKETFKSVGQNKYILTMEDIVGFIKEGESNGKLVSSALLRKFFRADAEPGKFNELIDGLVSSRDIELCRSGREGDMEFYYRIVK